MYLDSSWKTKKASCCSAAGNHEKLANDLLNCSLNLVYISASTLLRESAVYPSGNGENQKEYTQSSDLNFGKHLNASARMT